MSFAEYWKLNGEWFTQLGVSEAVARKIWKDCADAIEKKIVDDLISKL